MPAERKMAPSLLGMDVGFSEARRTTAFAWRIGGRIGVAVSGTSWESRRAVLPEHRRFEVAALDGPLVPSSDQTAARACEAVLYRRPFWNRCRPGLSHYGRGMDLRRAGADAAVQIAAVVSPTGLGRGPEVMPGVPVVEAFPNAFLGVMLPKKAYASSGRPARRSKSDWLYERALEGGALARVLLHLGWNDPETRARVETETHHERRAALVCLLTAGLAHMGNATIVGDPAGGWLWLPPIAMWAPWAVQGLDEAIGRSRFRGFPTASVWSRPADR
jgi:predicted nuclease with RNAse H fold